MKRLFLRIRNSKRGQSFAELMLVVLILALLLAGVVEFGFVMNQYLHLLDAGREAARYSNTSRPLAENGTSIQQFYAVTAVQAIRVAQPILLNGNDGDDIVISVLSVAGTHIARFPDDDGWSLCANYNDSELRSYMNAAELNDFVANWSSCVPHQSSQLTADLHSQIDPAAPSTGILVVEIFYNYYQILALPVFTEIVPNPIPIYVYTFMPLSAAEPTSTPRP